VNAITIYGKISSEPVYAAKGARTKTLDFIVAVKRHSKKPGGAGADFIPVRIWGALADDVKDVEYGDRILIHGRLRVERDGTCVVSAHDAWLPDYEEDTHGGRKK